jgi:hypothetical protein
MMMKSELKKYHFKEKILCVITGTPLWVPKNIDFFKNSFEPGKGVGHSNP